MLTPGKVVEYGFLLLVFYSESAALRAGRSNAMCFLHVIATSYVGEHVSKGVTKMYVGVTSCL